MNIYLDNLVSFTCSLRLVYRGLCGCFELFCRDESSNLFLFFNWSSRWFCVPFPAADINPILPILEARLGSISTMELRLIRLFTEELYFPVLHCCFLFRVLIYLPSPTNWLSSGALRYRFYFKIRNSRAHKVKYLKEPWGKVGNWARLNGAHVKGRTYILGEITLIVAESYLVGG